MASEASTASFNMLSSTDWLSYETNTTAATVVSPHFCKSILYRTIGTSLIQVWDVLILVPNALFLIYLSLKMHSAIVKLRRTNSPMFTAYFSLVFIAVTISTLRCFISMAVHAVSYVNIADRVMWLVLKFFLFATEISVICFSLWFGHLDSRSSIQRVLVVTFSISLAYSVTQGVMEFVYQNPAFHNIPGGTGSLYTLFGHGGILFWFISSVCLCVIYVIICVLPFTSLCIRQLFILPSKKSFYVYCVLLAALDAAQAVGSGLINFEQVHGMCVVDITSFLYFTGFAPLIYLVFLRSFFTIARPTTIHFTYKSQIDEAEADDVILPQHYAGLERPITSINDVDITQFNGSSSVVASPNPLYRLLDNDADLRLTQHFYPAADASMDRIV